MFQRPDRTPRGNCRRLNRTHGCRRDGLVQTSIIWSFRSPTGDGSNVDDAALQKVREPDRPDGMHPCARSRLDGNKRHVQRREIDGSRVIRLSRGRQFRQTRRLIAGRCVLAPASSILKVNGGGDVLFNCLATPRRFTLSRAAPPQSRARKVSCRPIPYAGKNAGRIGRSNLHTASQRVGHASEGPFCAGTRGGSRSKILSYHQLSDSPRCSPRPGKALCSSPSLATGSRRTFSRVSPSGVSVSLGHSMATYRANPSGDRRRLRLKHLFNAMRRGNREPGRSPQHCRDADVFVRVDCGWESTSMRDAPAPCAGASPCRHGCHATVGGKRSTFTCRREDDRP